MANKNEIVNNALNKIGMRRITDINDGTPEANTALANYNISLESILSAGTFTFSIERRILSLTDETPDYIENGMSLMYSIPNDNLRILDFFPRSARTRVEGGYIYSDTESLVVRMVTRQENTSLYFPAFTEAFAVKLAADMSFSLTNGNTRGGELLQLFEATMLPRAKSADSSQGDSMEQEPSEILAAKDGNY